MRAQKKRPVFSCTHAPSRCPDGQSLDHGLGSTKTDVRTAFEGTKPVYRPCVVQQSTSDWSIYVLVHTEQIANFAASIGLAGHAVDELDLAAAGAHP